ncbi:hypothetical protein V1503_18975 [Bacillus sp. SCS-151]|uniref:hypothetical protein n=1 Tax=Nanhaiella sioensis TaxID=3115293 RepID=UPI00397A9528
MLGFGFHDYNTPKWKLELDALSDDLIYKTALSKDKLEKVLHVLYEHRVIN